MIVGNFEKNPKKECGPNSLSPLRGTNSETKLVLVFSGCTRITLTLVILDLNTLSGTKPRILTPKRYDNYPRHFYMGVFLGTALDTLLADEYTRENTMNETHLRRNCSWPSLKWYYFHMQLSEAYKSRCRSFHLSHTPFCHRECILDKHKVQQTDT